MKQQSGRALGCCPFHEENTPSFYVFKDHYHCFGCGAHGDSISFIRNTHGLGFIETLKWLNNKFALGLTLKIKTKTEVKLKELPLKIKSLTPHKNLYQKALLSPAGQQAYQYLLQRGFTPELIKEYNFGFAPKAKTIYGKLYISKDSLINKYKSVHF